MTSLTGSVSRDLHHISVFGRSPYTHSESSSEEIIFGASELKKKNHNSFPGIGKCCKWWYDVWGAKGTKHQSRSWGGNTVTIWASGIHCEKAEPLDSVGVHSWNGLLQTWWYGLPPCTPGHNQYGCGQSDLTAYREDNQHGDTETCVLWQLSTNLSGSMDTKTWNTDKKKPGFYGQCDTQKTYLQ